MEDRIDKLERVIDHQVLWPATDVATVVTLSHNAQNAALNQSGLKTQKKRIRVGIDAPMPTLEQQGAEPRSKEQ
ncbi:hypothetical protein PoB_004600500 [Plakobranchus ocellatus]|uniref:Uncharacterized protein n=1 Tax=Plakobranchus ocellatus TaxID=259542 RepID=A0AAV4BKB4_9GAST|nr:hypothetical protein PoB_004600500 [Plakobranchus ocellatus]